MMAYDVVAAGSTSRCHTVEISGCRMTDDEVLALVQPALKRVPGGGYRQAPHDKTGLIVPRKDVRRLVERGALLWVNRCRSAAVKTFGQVPSVRL